MSTEQAELTRPLTNGNVAHHSVLKKLSKSHAFQSLNAFIRDFPRPIRTFNICRRAKLAQNLGSISGTDSHGQDAITVSSHTATRGEKMPKSPAVTQQPAPVTSEPGEHDSQVHTQGKSSPHAKTDTLPAGHGQVLIGPAQPPTPPESICTLATGTNIKEQITLPNLAPGGSQTQAEPSSAQKGIQAFILRDKCLYEATRMHPERGLRDQWRSSGKPTIDKRLRNLRLGPNILFNLRLCMMGPFADEKCMRPTILIVCDRNRVKEVENGLKEFVRVSFPDYMDFKVIPGSVRLASGAMCGLPSMPGDRTDLTVMTFAEAGSFPFLAIAGQFGFDYNRHYKNIWRSDSYTIGGTIAVGNSLYGLTVAHSVRKGRSLLNSREKHRFYTFCGRIEFYEWSGQEDDKAEDPTGPAKWRIISALAMDWMLLRLDKRYTSLNKFSAFDGAVQQSVSGFVRTADLQDGEVWIFSTHPQTGILDSAPSTIVLGQVSYEVLSIALEFPLGMPNSFVPTLITEIC